MRLRKGFALLTALWVGVVTVTLTNSVLVNTVDDRAEMSLHRERFLALEAARAGIERGISVLVQDDRRVDHLGEPWAWPVHQASEQELLWNGKSRQWYRFCGVSQHSGTRPVFSLVDEDRRIDVFRSPVSLIEKIPGIRKEAMGAWRALLSSSGQRSSDRPLVATPQLLVDAAVVRPDVFFGEDWNDNGLLEENENDGDRSFPPDDMDGRVRPGLSSLFTAWTDGRVNVNTASADVLRAVGLAAEKVEKFLNARIDRSKGIEHLEEVLGPGLPAVAKWLKVNSSTFRLNVEGGTLNVEGGTQPAASLVRVERLVTRGAKRIFVSGGSEDL